MPSGADIVIELQALDARDDVLFNAKESLIKELNEFGPIATGSGRVESGSAKGTIEDLASIGIALLSAGAIKYIAQVIVAFVKRNNRYCVQIGDLKICKDNATAQDTDIILKHLEGLLQKRYVARRKKK